MGLVIFKPKKNAKVVIKKKPQLSAMITVPNKNGIKTHD